MKHIVLNRGCQSNWVGGEGGYRLSIQGLYVVLFELRLISAKVGQITGTKNILDCSIRIKTYSESLGKNPNRSKMQYKINKSLTITEESNQWL